MKMGKKKGGRNMGIMVKPIQETPELSGKFAQDFLKEATKKPSLSAIERNKKAQALLRRMKR